jgi:2-aminobenzoate-CoA ligase
VERERHHGDGWSAHTDGFVRERLPPRELWPELDLDALPWMRTRTRLNSANDLLVHWMELGDGARTVIRTPNERWSYADLHAAASRIAHVLVSDLGLEPGNRVLLRGPNTPMMAACWYAVLMAGGVCVTTMPMLRAREIGYTLDRAGVSLALCDARTLAECEQAARSAGVRVVPFNDHGAGTLEDMMRRRPASFTPVDTAADDPAIIAFTSGTTGKAKGTVHFHRDILAICDAFPARVLRCTRDDLFCGSPPLAFTFGLGGLLLFPMRIGAASLLLYQAQPPHLLA